eukprot:TRINITY_DN8403_c0_g2_i2.p3 TRINITY_DN8403_c0_g2~~TRINITY_DN8403_c0_g2_i2.p3  ORF type:complete len:224 (+),score=11.34 TRINITY_DN8403_c0_g2_i2:197-868(+)
MLWASLRGDSRLRAALAMAWGMALRCGARGDLQALEPRDVVAVAPTRFRVKFWRTKEAKLRRDPLTMMYAFSRADADAVRRWVEAGVPFTPADSARVIRLLRAAGLRRASGQSLKRGALQHASIAGASWDDLQVLARHSSQDHLRRYLWGCVTPDDVRMHSVGAALARPVPAEGVWGTREQGGRLWDTRDRAIPATQRPRRWTTRTCPPSGTRTRIPKAPGET